MPAQSAGTRTAPLAIDDDDDSVEIKPEVGDDYANDDDDLDPAIIETIQKHLSHHLRTTAGLRSGNKATIRRQLQIVIGDVRRLRGRKFLSLKQKLLADFLETYHTWASYHVGDDGYGLNDSVEDIACEFQGYDEKKMQEVIGMLRYWKGIRKGVVLRVVKMWSSVFCDTKRLRVKHQRERAMYN